MITYLEKTHTSLLHKILCSFIALTFLSSVVLPPRLVAAQLVPPTVLDLPVPGTMVPPSAGFMPALMTGVTIHPDNPLRFDFIMDRGQSDLSGEPLKEEYKKMIKYFMASLTVPEDELWVNLSPYEKDRMIPQGLGATEMGRDMLAQDYLLKQLTASLMYPEKELGKEFWDRIYKKAKEQFGTTEIPVNTFNKVWVVPDGALVYEQGSSAFVIKSRLAVMLEEDYVAANSNVGTGLKPVPTDDNTSVSTEIIREVILPAIEKEVNEGKNFANLRQIYNALILATWYKQRLKDSLLGKVYVDQNKTKGIDTQDKEVNQKIYDQYIESFKKGVYNFIKEDVDPATQEVIPRKYFSGGERWYLGAMKKLGVVFAIGTLFSFGNMNAVSAQEIADALHKSDQQAVVTQITEIGPKTKDVEAGIQVTVESGSVQPLLLLAQAAEGMQPGGITEKFYGSPVDVRDVELKGKVYIYNNSGQSIKLSEQAGRFFPKTPEGKPLVQDTVLVIQHSADAAMAASPVVSSPIGRKLTNIVLAVGAAGVIICSSGCPGPAPTPPQPPIIKVFDTNLAVNWMDSQINTTTNLIKSFQDLPSNDPSFNVTWSFNQAQAIEGFLAGGQVSKAKRLAEGLLALQGADGSWFNAYLTDEGSVATNLSEQSGRWVGPNVVVGRALLDVAQATGEEKYADAARRLTGWLDKFFNDRGTYGYLTGGEGIPWTATEHNMRAMALYDRLGDKARADLIAAWINTKMFAGDHYYVGYSSGETVNTDPTKATDVQFLGPVMALHGGRDPEAFAGGIDWLLEHQTEIVYDNQHIFGIPRWLNTKSIWLEGTGGLAVALQVLGRDGEAEKFLSSIGILQRSDGSLLAAIVATPGGPVNWPVNFPYPTPEALNPGVAAIENDPRHLAKPLVEAQEPSPPETEFHAGPPGSSSPIVAAASSQNEVARFTQALRELYPQATFGKIVRYLEQSVTPERFISSRRDVDIIRNALTYDNLVYIRPEILGFAIIPTTFVNVIARETKLDKGDVIAVLRKTGFLELYSRLIASSGEKENALSDVAADIDRQIRHWERLRESEAAGLKTKKWAILQLGQIAGMNIQQRGKVEALLRKALADFDLNRVAGLSLFDIEKKYGRATSSPVELTQQEKEIRAELFKWTRGFETAVIKIERQKWGLSPEQTIAMLRDIFGMAVVESLPDGAQFKGFQDPLAEIPVRRQYKIFSFLVSRSQFGTKSIRVDLNKNFSDISAFRLRRLLTGDVFRMLEVGAGNRNPDDLYFDKFSPGEVLNRLEGKKRSASPVVSAKDHVVKLVQVLRESGAEIGEKDVVEYMRSSITHEKILYGPMEDLWRDNITFEGLAKEKIGFLRSVIVPIAFVNAIARKTGRDRKDIILVLQNIDFLGFYSHNLLSSAGFFEANDDEGMAQLITRVEDTKQAAPLGGEDLVSLMGGKAGMPISKSVDRGESVSVNLELLLEAGFGSDIDISYDGPFLRVRLLKTGGITALLQDNGLAVGKDKEYGLADGGSYLIDENDEVLSGREGESGKEKIRIAREGNNIIIENLNLAVPLEIEYLAKSSSPVTSYEELNEKGKAVVNRYIVPFLSSRGDNRLAEEKIEAAVKMLMDMGAKIKLLAQRDLSKDFTNEENMLINYMHEVSNLPRGDAWRLLAYASLGPEETKTVDNLMQNKGKSLGGALMQVEKDRLSKSSARPASSQASGEGSSSPVRQIDSNLARPRQDPRFWRVDNDNVSEPVIAAQNPGGIDLNPALLDLQIKRDGNGVPLPLPLQPVENMHIDGFLPVIINIVPIANLPLLLGLDLPPQQDDPVKLTYQQLSLYLPQSKERFFMRGPEKAFA